MSVETYLNTGVAYILMAWFFRNKDSLSLTVVYSRLKKAFSKIRMELNDHLDAINANTNEIQSNYEYLCEIDRKVEKLSERIDEISLFLGLKRPEKTFQIGPLTRNEQEVFMGLYRLGTEKEYTTYPELARRLCLTENLVTNYVTNLIEKGVPLVKKYQNSTVHIKLDPEFREAQTKQNIVKVHESLNRFIEQDD